MFVLMIVPVLEPIFVPMIVPILEPIFVPMFLPMFVASPTHVYLCFRNLLPARGTVITHQGKCFFKC